MCIPIRHFPSVRFAQFMNNSEVQRILGVDPGLNVTGYGVIEKSQAGIEVIEAGIIKGGSSKKPITDRLDAIYKGISAVIKTCEVDIVAIEELYAHYERPTTAILMGHARGVICLAASHCELPVTHYAATKIKRMLTGNGRAPKSQMQNAVQNQLALAEIPDPPDVADALAIAMCHYYVSTSPKVGL